MANTLRQPDVTQFTAFVRGDEDELARIFRTEYDALLERASEALGPELAHHAGRVAHQAMLDVWERRVQLTDVSVMTSTLTQAILDEAAVQRRKHAALHHGRSAATHAPHDHTLPTEQAVAQLLAEVHAVPADRERAVLESQVEMKRHAAEHVQHVARTGGWKVPVALIAVLSMVIIAAMRWMNATGSEFAATKALKAEGARSLTSARGQRGTTTLNDGSVVRIGSETRVRIPADFGVLVRTLELSGSAAFTVAAGSSQPLVVRAANATITAGGTTFAVRAFDDEQAVIIAVDEGTVSVSVKDQSGHTDVAAGSAVRVARDGSTQTVDVVERTRMLGWLRDSLSFTNEPVRTVLQELNRWFDLKASLGDAALGDRPVTMRVSLESSGNALKALASAAKLSVGFDAKQQVVLRDAPVPTTSSAASSAKRPAKAKAAASTSKRRP